MSLTQGCSKCLNHGNANMPMCPACRTQMARLDAVAYLVAYLPMESNYGVSGYYGYYSSAAANMAYKAGMSLGYGASAFNDAGACWECDYGRRRLSETGNRRLEQANYAHTDWGDPSFKISALPNDDNKEDAATTLLDDVTTATYT